jgi:RimJ/RimL family protein N-acetyltransferase
MTHNLCLREVTVNDLPILFAYQQDPEASRMAAFPARGWDDFRTHWMKILGDATIITKAILFDDQVAGSIVSWEQAGEREVGYWLGKDYWGQGIATSALGMFLDLDMTRPLYAHVAKHNRASLRVLEKCGFTICGEHTALFTSNSEAVDAWILIIGPDR